MSQLEAGKTPSAPRAGETSGLPAGPGARAGWGFFRACALGLALASVAWVAWVGNVSAAELPDDPPPPPSQPEDNAHAPEIVAPEWLWRQGVKPDGFPNPPDWPNKGFMTFPRYHLMTFLGGAEYAWLPYALSARAATWRGTQLPQPHGAAVDSGLLQGRLVFRLQRDDAEHQRSADGLIFMALTASDLYATWHDAARQRYALDWQSFRMSFGVGHAGINSLLIPVAGSAWLFDLGAAVDHLALLAGGRTRTRDGVRCTLGLLHLNGFIWDTKGFTVGAKIDSEAGIGALEGRLYGVAGFEFEPRLGFNFRRPDLDGHGIPWCVLSLGFKTGGRWLWNNGPRPIQLQTAFWVAPTLTVQLFF